MRNDIDSAASQSYATAHEAHYGSKDLRRALGLYEDTMAAYPETEEEGYSRSQIQNIVKAVVPAQELLAAQMALARSHLAGGDPTPVTKNETKR